MKSNINTPADGTFQIGVPTTKPRKDPTMPLGGMCMVRKIVMPCESKSSKAVVAQQTSEIKSSQKRVVESPLCQEMYSAAVKGGVTEECFEELEKFLFVCKLDTNWAKQHLSFPGGGSIFFNCSVDVCSTNLTSLPDNLTINGDLLLMTNPHLESFGANIVVNGRTSHFHCPKLPPMKS